MEIRPENDSLCVNNARLEDDRNVKEAPTSQGWVYANMKNADVKTFPLEHAKHRRKHTSKTNNGTAGDTHVAGSAGLGGSGAGRSASGGGVGPTRARLRTSTGVLALDDAV